MDQVSPRQTAKVKRGFRAKIRSHIRRSGKTIMRHLLFCLACLPAVALAQQAPGNFDQEKFEVRFRAADKDGDGRLSRAEAAAAFPTITKFFVEIDANNDDFITVIEVNQAQARRIEAAVNASSISAAARYVKPDYIRGGQAPAGEEVDTSDLSSAIAHARSREFNEFLGDESGGTVARSTSAPVKSSTSNLLNKSFW
jgi:hypothetical protein